MNSVTTFLQIAVPGAIELLVLLFVFGLVGVLAGVWVYRDAGRRGMNAALWAVLVAGLFLVGFLPGLLALVVYLWARGRDRQPVSGPRTA